MKILHLLLIYRGMPLLLSRLTNKYQGCPTNSVGTTGFAHAKEHSWTPPYIKCDSEPLYQTFLCCTSFFKVKYQVSLTSPFHLPISNAVDLAWVPHPNRGPSLATPAYGTTNI